MNLRDYFEKVKKVGPATLKNYMLMLRKLNENEEPTTPEFLKNVDLEKINFEIKIADFGMSKKYFKLIF